MKKFIFFLFLLFLIGLVSVSALTFGVEVTEGEDGGILIVKFQTKEFNILDIIQPQAIIPTFVNAGSTIQFKGELRKVTDFTGFLFGVPDRIIIRIYEFDSSKSNFLGTQVNSFTITIPESARQSLSNPLTTIIIFDAQMTAPTQIGKYRYEAEPRFGNFRETSIQLDYDTFTVQAGVPEICNLPSTETTFQDITGGQLKIITLTEEFGLDCTLSITKTYNAICDEGYNAVGSGASSSCELRQICGNNILESPEECDDGNIINGDGCSSTCKNEDVSAPTGCASNQVCCEFNVWTFNPSTGINDVTPETECRLPTQCSWFPDNGKAVPNDNCGGASGSGSGAVVICGDGKKEGDEECDDNNKISGDGCSNICKTEVPAGVVKGILEEQLDDKTEDELEDSACKRTSDCESGADCIPFDKLSLAVRERLAGGLFNIAEDGICVFPEPEKEVFDINEIGCTVGESLGIKDNPCVWGWIILVVGTLVVLGIISKIGRGK